MSAKDDLTVFLNVLARVGLDGDAVAEFSRAKSMMHRMDSNSLLQAQQKMSQNSGNLAPITPEPMVDTTQGEIVPPTAQNPMQNV